MTWTLASYSGGELASRTDISTTELDELFMCLSTVGWRETQLPWNDTRILRDDLGSKLIAVAH